MSDSDITIVGLDEVQEALEKVPRGIARGLLRTGLARAANIWRQEIARRAPRLAVVKLATNPKEVRLPGDLSRHIGMKVIVNSDLEASARVGPTKRVFWASFLEFGTRKMRAQPFIRPAFESMASAVLDRFVEEGRLILAQILPSAPLPPEVPVTLSPSFEAENRRGWDELTAKIEACNASLAEDLAFLNMSPEERDLAWMKADPIGWKDAHDWDEIEGMMD